MIKEGKIEGKLDDARRMHEKGFSIDDILDITGLSSDDLINAGKITN